MGLNNVQIFLAMCYITLVSSVLFGLLHSVFTYIMWWGDRRDKQIKAEADKICKPFIKKFLSRTTGKKATMFLIDGTDDVDMVAVRQYLKTDRKAIESIDFEVIKN